MAANDVAWRPNSRAQFMFMAATEFEALFGGARGPGKSRALVAMALRYIDRPHYKAAIFRRTYPQLLELTDFAARIYRAAGGVGRDNNTEFVFPSGAQILFRHLQHEKDCDNYQGHQYQFLGYDELTHFTWRQYDTMRACCRTEDADIRCMVRCTANPGGFGHAWVKEYFIDRCPPVEVGKPIHDPVFKVTWQPKKPGPGYIDPNGLSRQFYPAVVFDNPDLLRTNPEYVQNLKGQDEKRRKANLEGDWDVYEGQYFTEWDAALVVRPPRHVQPDEHQPGHTDQWGIPPSWERFGGIDYGSANPWAACELAVDPASGRVILYRAIAAKGWTHEQQAKWLLAGAPRCSWVADDACFARGNPADAKVRQMSDAELWSEAGFHDVRPAQKGYRVPGWHHMREFFRPFPTDPTCAWLEISDTAGARGPYGIITTIPKMVHSELHPEDMETDCPDEARDDAVDSLRFGLLSRPTPAPPPPPPPKFAPDDYQPPKREEDEEVW